jgi:hypothetical protein
MSIYISSRYKVDQPRHYHGGEIDISCKYSETKTMANRELGIFCGTREIVKLTGNTPVEVVISVIKGATKKHLELIQASIARRLEEIRVDNENESV